MEYLSSPVTWESYFTEEYEELKSRLGHKKEVNSPLRAALQHNVVTWESYSTWARDYFGICSIDAIPHQDLARFTQMCTAAFNGNSKYNFWSTDLVPLAIWHGQIVVIGLQVNAEVAKIPNHIFFLAPPGVLDMFVSVVNPVKSNSPSLMDKLDSTQIESIKLSDENSDQEDHHDAKDEKPSTNEKESAHDEKQNELISGLSEVVAPIDFDFKSLVEKQKSSSKKSG